MVFVLIQNYYRKTLCPTPPLSNAPPLWNRKNLGRSHFGDNFLAPINFS